MSWWPHQAPVKIVLWLGQVMLGKLTVEPKRKRALRSRMRRRFVMRGSLRSSRSPQLAVAQAVEDDEVDADGYPEPVSGVSR